MVVLEKEPDAKLGISIRGGGKGSKGNPLDRNDEGIFISKVRKDSDTGCYLQVHLSSLSVLVYMCGLVEERSDFSLFTCGRLPLEEQLIRTAV